MESQDKFTFVRLSTELVFTPLHQPPLQGGDIDIQNEDLIEAVYKTPKVP